MLKESYYASRFEVSTVNSYKFLFLYLKGNYQNSDKTKKFTYEDLIIYEVEGKGATSPPPIIKEKFMKWYRNNKRI